MLGVGEDMKIATYRTRAFVAAVLTLVLLPCTVVYGAEEVVFGPKTYAHSQFLPTVHFESFRLPSGATVPFRVQIKNGRDDGRDRVETAWLFVNDELVAGPRDFDRQTHQFDRPVALKPQNVILVIIVGRRGSFFEATVFARRPDTVPTSLAPNPLSITHGAESELIATLAPAPLTQGTLSVSSENPNIATVPASVGFAPGQTAVRIPVSALSEGTTAVTVTLNGVSATATVRVTPGVPRVVSLLPPATALTQGASSNLTVRLSSAPAVDTNVEITSSDSGVVSVPGVVTVPAGQGEARVPVEGIAPGVAQITAILNGSSASSQVTVTAAPPTLISLTPALSTLTLGASAMLQVTISAPQATDTTVSLESAPPGILSVPTNVVVPAGQTTADVPVEGIGLGQAGVTAVLNNSTASALVNVVAPPLEVVALEPESVRMTAGATTGFVVRINAVQADNTEIALSSSDAGILEVPASVTVDAGQTRANFVARARATGDAVITASANGTFRQASVHVSPQPAAVVALVPSPLPLQEGATGLLIVTINAAQEQETVIDLANDATSVVQVPATVTILAGELSAEIPATGLSPGSALITASVNGTSVSARVDVTLAPPVVTALSPANMALPKGTPGTLRVTISRGPIAPVTVALSSSDETVAAVPAEVTVAAGALFADFPVASLSVGEATILASLNGGTASALVTVVEPEPLSLTLFPAAPTVLVGETVAFSAIATMTDASMEDVTSLATWASSDPSVASIDAEGVATALSEGTTTISATFTFTSTATGQITTITAEAVLTVFRHPTLVLTAPTSEVTVGESMNINLSSSELAPDGGLRVTLSATGTGGATFPMEVTIPAGGTMTDFALTGTIVGEVTLTASAPGYDSGSLTLLVQPVLRIDSIAPTRGPVGSSVELIGNGFDATPSGNVVVFPRAEGGTVPGHVLVASPTRLTVRVPPTAESGVIRLTNANGSATSPPFTVVREQDFELVVSPAVMTVYGGASNLTQVQLASTGALPFTGLVSLVAEGLPPGTVARFLPAPVLSANQHVALEIEAAAGTMPGAHPVIVRGEFIEAGQSLVRTAGVDLQIQAVSGMAGVKGRFVTPEKVGIAGVIVRADLPSGPVQTTTDAAGNFQLADLPVGRVTLRFDATPANPLYPIWPYTTELPANQITVFPDWTINPPPSNDRFTPINTTTEQVITDARFPGLEVRLPAGASIIGWDGVPKTRIAVEKVEISKLPVPAPPTPTGAAYQLYFGTPMGGIPSVPIPVTLPNDVAAEPGESVDVWFFDGSPMALSGEWKVAGQAIVSADGKSATMLPGTGVPRFCGVCGLVCLGKQPPAPDPPPVLPLPGVTAAPNSCPLPTAGNPVELFTGQEMPNTSGLSCRGLTPFEARARYNPVDAFDNIGGTAASLGFGWVLDHDIAFLPFAGPQKRLVLSGNDRVNFVDDGAGNYRPFDDPRFDGAAFRATNLAANEWELTFRDRTKWRFKPFTTVFVRGGPPTFLVEMVDPQGNVLEIRRQSNGRITSIGTSERGVSMTYGANGFVSQIRDTAGRTMQYTYTPDNRLEAVTDADDRVTRYTYVGDDEFAVPPVCGPQPSFGKRLKTILYPGRPDPTVNSYGPGRRVLRQVGYDGREYRFAYRVTGACVTHVSSPGAACAGGHCPNVDSWENFEAGWRMFGGTVVATTVTKPDGNTFTHEFNTSGMTTARINEEGQRSTFTLDAGNRLVARTDLLHRVWRYAYDAKGNLEEATDPLDRVTQYTYDPTWNRATRITRFDEMDAPQTLQFSYDADKGTLLTATNPLNETVHFTHTARGELETIRSPLDQVTQLVYESTGDVSKHIDPLGNETRFGYDDAGRQIGKSPPLGSESRWQYNGVGGLIRSTDGLGQSTRIDYDSAGRLSTVTNARGNPIESYSYDSGDRLTERTDALGRSTRYGYDAAGRLRDMTDRRGQVSSFTYDVQGRVASIARPEGVSRLSYDAVGRLIEISEPGSTLSYTHDAVDRLVREVQITDAMRTEVTYGYDALDRRVSRSVSGVVGEITTYGYDRVNRLASILYRGETTTFEYDDAGRLQTKTLPNGIRQVLTYDNADRLMSIVYRNPDDTVVDTIAYEYDANGRRISQTSSRGTLADTPFTAIYDAADRMTSLTLTDTGQTFDLAYDDNGNLTNKIERGAPNNVTTYTWDSRNRLTRISGPNGEGTFAYDALGRRIARNVNGERVDYIYDGLQAVGEVTAGGPAGLLTALGLDEVIARYSSAGARYYLTDALNNVIAQTRADLSVQNLYIYSPYGNTSSLGPDEGNPVQYTARENDRTGLYYYRARYFDPEISRFVSEDPIHFVGGLNLYRYVGGDPILSNDPLGLVTRLERQDVDWPTQDEVNLRSWVLGLLTDVFGGSAYGPIRINLGILNVASGVIGALTSTTALQGLESLAGTLAILPCPYSLVFAGIGALSVIPEQVQLNFLLGPILTFVDPFGALRQMWLLRPYPDPSDLRRRGIV